MGARWGFATRSMGGGRTGALGGRGVDGGGGVSISCDGVLWDGAHSALGSASWGVRCSGWWWSVCGSRVFYTKCRTHY